MDCLRSARQVVAVFLAGLALLVASIPALAQDDARAAVLGAAVQGWLDAWQAQDTDAYLGHYHPDFMPDGGASVETWRAGRIRNITRPAAITIEAEPLEIAIAGDGDSAVVRFWFVYRSPDYADRTRKELDMARGPGGDWLITAEHNLEVQRLPVAGSVTESGATNDAADNDAESPTQALQADNTPPPAQARDTAAPPEPAGEAAVAPPVATAATGQTPTPPQTPPAQADAGTPAPASSPRSDWVPPGFENLDQPQVTEIDVFYGGFYLTSALAEFTSTEVRFLDPDALLDSIGNLKDPQAVRLLLEDSLDAHQALLCFSDFQVDCGNLDTDSVGVIFDRDRLRVSLFIAPALLLSANDDQLRFLPASEAGLSFLNQTAFFFSGEDSSVDNYNLFNNTLLAFRENRLSMRSNLVSEEGFNIDTLALMREFQGRDYRLGLMREDANGFSFMANERFQGIALASSLLTRTDLEQSLGTEIELFFPTRSRVEIYREGRLISTDYYNVGNNILDTSSLPNGSYTIEIRIIDATGNTTVEERYYSKTARIAPADQPLYFFHAGRLKNELDVNRLSVIGEETFARGGINLRLGQSLGGSVGFSALKDSQMFEAGLFKQGRRYEFQANTAVEDNGASGVDLRVRYRHPDYSLTVNTRQVFNGEQDSQMGLDYNQYYAMLEVPLRSGYLSLFHRETKRPLTGGSSNSGLRYRSRGRDFGSGTLNTNFELSRNAGGVIALLTFSYQLQRDNRTTVIEPKLSYANAASSRDSGVYGSYQESWYTGQRTGSEYRFTMRGDYDYQNSMEGRFESNTELGSSDVIARYNGESKNMEYSGRLSTSYATNGQTSSFGGKRRSESAFLVRVDGDPDSGARFEVMVNGVARGRIRARETLMLPVSPYQTYEVELKSVGDTLVSLDNRVYRETMYPGNVVNLSWATRVISIGIGRLVDADNRPLANAVIQNVVGIAITDENGFFQAEIDQNTDVLDVQRGNVSCEAAFDNPRDNATVMPLGTLVCR